MDASDTNLQADINTGSAPEFRFRLTVLEWIRNDWGRAGFGGNSGNPDL
jgi:hypothetical protein